MSLRTVQNSRLADWAKLDKITVTQPVDLDTIETASATIAPHIANLSNPHSVTKAQVGLSNVDDTSDLAKPISTATQTALNAKQGDLTLTTTGSGAATLIGDTLNIPQYGGWGGGTPASTVTDETTYWITPAVGVGTDYARNDHTHGTPATTKDKTAIIGLLKGNGTDVSQAVSGADYAPALGVDDNYVTDAEKTAIWTIGSKLESVVAGEWITVDNTDPLNPIVSASQSGTITYMMSAVNSDISGYESLPSLASYTAGSLTTVGQSVTTTPTILEEFATDIGYPNITVIPAGTVHVHIETQKVAGANNYYTYAEIYKRASGGTETLLLTTDNSSSTAVNTLVSTHIDAINPSNIPLLTTDRIVVKVYAVMVSSTATINLLYDDTTNARIELPSVTVDATNFVPYTGATQNVDLGTKSIVASNLSWTNTGNDKTAIGGLLKGNGSIIISATAGAGGDFTNPTHDHISGNWNPIVEGALSLSDITTWNATSSRHWFLPKLSNSASEYLNGQGNYATPSGTTTSFLTQTFTAQTSVNVVHNFWTYPVVQVMDGSNAVLIPLTITHNTANDFTMTFASSTSGRIVASVGSPQPQSYIDVSSNYTVLTTDYTINATSGNFTITLPTAVGSWGRIYWIKNSGNGTITLATTSSQTIDGYLTGTITMTYLDSFCLQSNGANWILLNF